MRYFATTQTVQADGEIYGVLRRKNTVHGTRVVARRNDNWIMGTFRADGTLVNSCMRAYGEPIESCCTTAWYEGKLCDHMGAACRD